MSTHNRHALAALAAVGTLGIVVAVMTAGAAPAIPVPGPLVKVRTESGGVVRERVIPLGGAPVPIDVDDRFVGGLLTPDVDVSVGMIAAEELPGKLVVPTIDVSRNALAVTRGTPAPPLRIDFTLEINDASSLMRRIATVTYGYETPAGGLAPTKFRSKLIGPVEGGFVDPLEASIETPGYSGPLTLNAKVVTGSLDDTFAVNVDPLPERIHFRADPIADGLDFTYDHQGPLPDVRMAATADLRDPGSGRVRHVEASVERVPQRIDIHTISTDERVFVEYEATSPLAKPDLHADYRDTLGDGTVITDANVKVAGLPLHMTGEALYKKVTGADPQIDSADFRVLDGAEIDALDFEARNFTGAPGPIPVPVLGPEQFLTVATRQMPSGKARFRAAGRVRGVRSVRFERTGPTDEGIDVRTDVGDGSRPLRAIVDLDNRGPGGPANPDDRRALLVDTTVAPLPPTIHVNYALAKGTDPTKIVYDAPTSVDVEARARIAEADATSDCGEAEVTCLQTTITGLPPHLEVDLPGDDGTDFRLSHNATTKPDARAVVDRTPNVVAERTWADVNLTGVPREVRGRLDAAGDVVRAAEFHGCATITLATCLSSPGVIDRVAFTVRDAPVRSGLPPRADVADQYVALVRRDAAFEVTGRVDGVHKVAFHQRDANEDDKPDGTLGALVAAGKGRPFRARVDQSETVRSVRGAVLGTKRTDVDVTVPSLPGQFSTCVREPDPEEKPPDPSSLPADGLLSQCDRTDVLGRTSSDPLSVTPLSAAYDADAKTKVHARIDLAEPDLNDLDANADPIPRTTRVVTGIDAIPAGVTRLDAITPDATSGRKLELAYGAPAAIGAIDFALEARRSSSLCADPRPRRKATCVSGRLENLPSSVAAVFDPDPAKGDIDITAPAGASGRLSINSDTTKAPFRLSHVAPDDPATTKDDSSRIVLDAHINEITDHLVGKLQQLDDPFDSSTERTLARVGFDACPDGGSCTGIKAIDFNATTAPAGDPFAGFAVPAPPSGVDQRFHFLQRGDELRASGHIEDLRELTYSRLSSDGTWSRATTLRTGFGAGKALHGYVDRDTGADTQVVDAILRDAAKTVELCLRSPVAPADVKTGPGASFCERADARKLAVQTRLLSAAQSVRPDIELRRLDIGRGGGTQTITGSANVQDLAERIDVLVGSGPPECADGVDNDGDGTIDTGVAVPGLPLIPGDSDCTSAEDDSENASGIATTEPPEVLVEGRDANGGLSSAAGRVGFDIATARSASGTSFPWTPLDATTIEPELDSASDDGGVRNYVKIVKDGDVLRATGSVPQVKRVSLAPEACHAGDPRFPKLSLFTNPSKRPEYLCANVVAAQGRPLGIAVRTREADNRILALDDAHVTEIPAGDGGLLITLTKTPEVMRLAKVCATPADAVGPDFCRPPLLSVQAKKASGQSDPVLRGRLAIGALELVKAVKELKPADDLSTRLDYEQRPADYPQRGARVKLGKRGDQVALRAGLKLALPNFLDLDPPTVYRCARLIGVVLNDPCAADAERPGEWGEDHDKGLEALDVFFKLVAANSAPGGSDVATLGRAAFLSHDFAPGGTQIVLTGVPPADQADMTADPPVPTGGSKHNPESPAPAGDHDLGTLAPGHLEAEVYMRNDFDAPSPTSTQQRFVQVDGRVNSPLSVAVRVNKPTCSKAFDFSTLTITDVCLPAGGANRGGGAVPGLAFAVRNAPGLGGGVSDYAKPTFRVRAEVRAGRRGAPFGQCVKIYIGCVYPPNSGDGGRLVNPQAKPVWLDVQLNMNPGGGNEPARTVEAIVDPIERAADVDLRGFTGVYTGPTPLASRGKAAFSAQAGLRLLPFNMYVRLGVAEDWLRLFGDLALFGASDRGRRLRLSQNAGRTGVAPDGGPIALNVNLRETLQDDPAIGKTLTTDLGRAPVDFHDCSSGAVGRNGFVATSLHDRGLTISPNAVPAFHVVRQPLLVPALAALPGVWCLGAIGPINVGRFPLSDTELIEPQPGAIYPAPRFNEPGRLVPGVGATANTSTPPSAPGTPPQPGPVTISGTETRCGSLTATTLTVTSTGKLEVGGPGTSVTEIVDGHPLSVACDGTLLVRADRVEVHSGGKIDAHAKVPGGQGTPTSEGGGAGHFGAGGHSGRPGSAGGPPYGPSDAVAVPTDVGSQGAGGLNATGGRGGGLVVIHARERIDIRGELDLTGGDGGDAPGAGCGQTAAGGGSGGAIHLDAPAVTVTGSLLAGGGAGGIGAHGGGGGAGGKIAIDTTARNTPGTIQANGGSGGAAESGCNVGAGGQPGKATLGTTQTRSATIARTGTNPPPYVTTTTVDLHFTGIQPAGGDLQFVYCRRFVPPGTAKPFETADLDPLGGGVTSTTTVEDLLDDPDATCEDVPGTATSPGGYEATISDTLPSDGYYGYYVLAAEPKSPSYHCADLNSARLLLCEYQELIPARTTIRLGRDRTPPHLTVTDRSGEPGCPDSSNCLTAPRGELTLRMGDLTSGPLAMACGVNRTQPSDPFPIACGQGRATIPLGSGDGLKKLDVRVEDVSGNTGVFADQARWFLDTKPPAKPNIGLTYPGTSHNGWYTQAPKLTIDVTDPAPSSGFRAGAIIVSVDGAEGTCGNAFTPGANQTATIGCASPVTDKFVPADGRHVFSARATDRLGNTSPQSAEVEMKVDTTAPSSRLFLAPEVSDGEGGWYRTKPQLAFGASDGAGGSGIDLRLRPAPNATDNVLRYQIDGGSFVDWDPTNDLEIDDGIHEICWYAIDRAGNKEAGGNPKANAPTTRCRTLKVDSTAPGASATLAPAAPNASGWYTTAPSVDPKGSDPVPSGVPANQTSGLDRVEYQLDGGAWKPAARFTVADGEHEVRVRAFDKAGNVAAIHDVLLKVDTVVPEAQLLSQPPAPNDQGWFRRTLRMSVAALDPRPASGVASATLSINGTVAPYDGPRALGHGQQTAEGVARDIAGLASLPAVQHPKIDLLAPVPRIVTPAPQPILAAGQTTTLRFSVDGTLSPRVKVLISIHDVLGRLVHRIAVAGSYAGGFRDAGAGQITWNGRDALGRSALPGLHHYRVQAIDQAGNSAVSTESAPFVVQGAL